MRRTWEGEKERERERETAIEWERMKDGKNRNNNRSIQTTVQLLSNYLNGEMLVASKFHCNCFVIIIFWRWSWSFAVAVLKVVGAFFFRCVTLWLILIQLFCVDVKRPTEAFHTHSPFLLCSKKTHTHTFSCAKEEKKRKV